MPHIMMDRELSEWTRNLLLANGIDNKVTLVRRVILDIGIEDVVKLYVELFADKSTFEAPIPAFKKVRIVRAPERPQPRPPLPTCRVFRDGEKEPVAIDVSPLVHPDDIPPEPTPGVRAPGENPPEQDVLTHAERLSLCQECLLHPDVQFTCPYPDGLPPGIRCDDYADRHTENDE